MFLSHAKTEERVLKINQSAKVRTFIRVETLNLFVTRTKTYSNSDVVLTAPSQKHLPPEEYHTQASKQGDLAEVYMGSAVFNRRRSVRIYLVDPAGQIASLQRNVSPLLSL